MEIGKGLDFGTKEIDLGPVLGDRGNSMGSETLIATLVGNSTLGAGVCIRTTLGTDVFGADNLKAKIYGDSGKVVMGGEDGIESTGGDEGNARRRTVNISRITFAVLSPNDRKGTGGLGSLISVMISPEDWYI